MKLFRGKTALICRWAVLAAVAAGVGEAGSLTGVIAGPGGEGLPGATISLGSTHRPERISVVSGEGGEFRFNGLEPAEYDLETSLDGFVPARVPSIRVDERKPTRIELVLASATFRDGVDVDASNPLDTLEATELRESGARDLGESMARMTGVWKVRKGGIANDVVLRGFREDNLTVLIDGARVTGACPNRMDPPAFHLDFAEIDRVEIGQGSDRLAAQGALGGLINVVTLKPGPGLHAGVHVGGGSFGYANPAATVSWGGERLAFVAGASQRRSDPFEDGSGRPFTESANYSAAVDGVSAFDVATAWGKLYYEPAEGHQLMLSYSRQKAEDVLYPTLMMDAVYDTTDRLILGYRRDLVSGPLKSFSAQVYGTEVDHWMVDSFRDTAAGAPRGWSMGTNATTQVVGGSVEAELWQVVLGLEAYRRNWDAWTEMAGMGYMRQLTVPDVDVDVLGLSALWDRPLGERTALQLGARLDRVATTADPTKANTDLYYAYHGTRSTSDEDLTPSFSAALTHDLGKGLKLNGSLSRTTRAPDPRERYFGLKRMGGDWVGNPMVVAPRATSAALGLTWNHDAGVVAASVWYDKVADFITLYAQDRVNMVPGVMNSVAKSYTNVDADLWGSSVDATAALSSRLFLSGGVALVRGTKSTDPERGIYSSNLAEMPPLTGRLALRWQSPAFFAEVEGVGADGQYDVDEDLSESPTAGYAVVNMRAGYRWGSWRLHLNVDNVFDRTYREHFSYSRDPFRSGFVLNEPGVTVSLILGWSV